MESKQGEAVDVAGLRGARALSLRRMPIRTRDSSVTRAGWSLVVSCSSGEGAVVLADSFYRGEGLLLGWPQERLAQLYSALTAAPAGDDGSGPQLG